MPEASMKTRGKTLEVATRMHVSQNPTNIIFSPSKSSKAMAVLAVPVVLALKWKRQQKAVN